MSQKLEDYEVICIIGRGSFGTCYKVKHKTTKQLYVWKAVDYGNLSDENKQNLVSEVNLLSQLNHPNIVKYYSRILHKETTTLYIITEWCEGGDLAGLIKQFKQANKYLEDEFIWRILYQVSRAIQVCHTKLEGFTVLHRDIKPANIFLDGQNNAKLGDFGLAKVEKEENASNDIVGTPFYLSPEVIRGHRHNRKSDIWALGCLVYEMCSFVPPFTGGTIKELSSNIKSGKYKEIPSYYTDNLKKVISFMLSVKHEFRPTIEMILHHPMVVMNIKSLPKPVKEVSKSSLSIEDVCLKALQNISMTNDAEEITQNTFKEKWLSRLESLRERETKLREKEEDVALKERSLINKEKHLALLERRAREKMALLDVQRQRRKDPMLMAMLHDDNLSDISADPGDTSIRPTAARIDPSQIAKPMFVRDTLETRSKRVHFKENRKVLGDHNSLRLPSNTSSSRSSDNSSEDYQQRFWLEHKKIQYQTRMLQEDQARISQREQVRMLHQDKENIVVKPSKKPDKTFRLVKFI